MSTEELKRRKLYILQEIEALRALQEEAYIRIDTRIELLASSSNLHPLHLKAFAQDWQDVNDLVSNLKEIAVKTFRDKSFSTYFSQERERAIHLQDTQYKSSSRDPDVYWTKPKALIVIDRVMMNFEEFNTQGAKQEISELFTEYEEMKKDRVLQILNQAFYMAKKKRENNE